MSCYDRSWRRGDWVYIDEIVTFWRDIPPPPGFNEPITSAVEADASTETETETEQP